MAHSRPGNIRELKNVVERSVCHWDDAGELIDTVVINPFKPEPEFSDQANVTESIPSILNVTEELPSQTFEERVKNYELGLIRKALSVCKSQKTAEYLRVTYHQLRALLKKYREEIV